MPRDNEPEIVTPTERAVDLADLLREHNELLRRYGPVMEEFVRCLKQGATPGKLGLADYLGQALVGGKFDELIGEVTGAARRTIDNPPRRKRR